MFLNPSQTRQLYTHAVTNQYAVLAANADSPAAVMDCLLAARECDAPIIIETSLWQLKGHSYGCGNAILGLDRYLADLRLLANSEMFTDVPVVYHTDHIKGPETRAILQHAMQSGASSISLDSSDLCPLENVDLMKELCAFAKESELPTTLEMEAGVDDGVTSEGETRTLFGAVELAFPGYLALWAPGVGTQHGLGDMAQFDPKAVRLHHCLASELAGRPIGIALHGSSGMTNEQLAAAVEAGVAKVNWSSESLLIRSHAARRYYAEYGDRLEKGHPEFKSMAMDNGVQTYVSSIYEMKVVERIRNLKGAGQGRKFLQEIS